tara:strand:- start:103 stop:930 length:828 start_codon:yes stop_codon:yes gene_type:complete
MQMIKKEQYQSPGNYLCRVDESNPGITKTSVGDALGLLSWINIPVPEGCKDVIIQHMEDNLEVDSSEPGTRKCHWKNTNPDFTELNKPENAICKQYIENNKQLISSIVRHPGTSGRWEDKPANSWESMYGFVVSSPSDQHIFAKAVGTFLLQEPTATAPTATATATPATATTTTPAAAAAAAAAPTAAPAPAPATATAAPAPAPAPAAPAPASAPQSCADLTEANFRGYNGAPCSTYAQGEINGAWCSDPSENIINDERCTQTAQQVCRTQCNRS